MAGRRGALVLPDVFVAGEDAAEVDVDDEPLVREVVVDVAQVVGNQHGREAPRGGIRRVRINVLGSGAVSPGWEQD